VAPNADKSPVLNRSSRVRSFIAATVSNGHATCQVASFSEKCRQFERGRWLSLAQLQSAAAVDVVALGAKMGKLGPSGSP
jgi:hypothetical protein